MSPPAPPAAQSDICNPTARLNDNSWLKLTAGCSHDYALLESVTMISDTTDAQLPGTHGRVSSLLPSVRIPKCRASPRERKKRKWVIRMKKQAIVLQTAENIKRPLASLGSLSLIRDASAGELRLCWRRRGSKDFKLTTSQEHHVASRLAALPSCNARMPVEIESKSLNDTECVGDSPAAISYFHPLQISTRPVKL